MTSPKKTPAALAPFPVPPCVADTDARAVEQPPKPLLVFSGDPTPDEIAAVTAAILAVLPRRTPPPPSPTTLARQRARRARWTPVNPPAGSWQRAS
ncbi:acyl-CoA carboxylase epsilon subunit [Streptomyces sp. NPDC048751]|uniref:acyl-CoA carboxylase epsilon subunit n=1 Tax=Streptomyces sp. NPDC048751 TaxID=3365591 RepID=UPI00371D189E